MKSIINETETKFAKAFRVTYANNIHAPWVLLNLLTKAKKRDKLGEIPIDILDEIKYIIDIKGTTIDKNNFSRIMGLGSVTAVCLEESEFAKNFREEYENCTKMPDKLIYMLSKAQSNGKFNEVPTDVLNEISDIIYTYGNEFNMIDFARITSANQILNEQEEEKKHNDESKFAMAFREIYERSIKKPFVIIVMLKYAKKIRKLNEIPADILDKMQNIIFTRGNDIDKNDFIKIIATAENDDVKSNCGNSHSTMSTSDVCVAAKTYKKR